MDAEAVRKKRQAELEEKRARLEALRKERDSRNDAKKLETAKSSSSSSGSSTRSSGRTSAATAAETAASVSRADVDSLVNSLLAGHEQDLTTSSDKNKTKSSDTSSKKVEDEKATAEGLPTPPPVTLGGEERGGGSGGEQQRPRPVLSVVPKVISVSFAPNSPIVYSKESQTDISSFVEDSDFFPLSGSGPGNSPALYRGRRASNVSRRTSQGSGSAIGDRDKENGGNLFSPDKPGSPRARGDSIGGDGDKEGGCSLTSTQASQDYGGELDGVQGTKHLTVEEIESMTVSDGFKGFLNSSSRIMDRLLSLGVNADGPLAALAFRDYSSDSSSKASAEAAVLSFRSSFEDKDWLELRPVHDLQNSPHHPELFLAAYGSKIIATGGRGGGGHGHAPMATNSETEIPGGVALWSMVTGKPEFRFSAPSAVLVARFHPFDSHIIIGGCTNGLVVLWDMRAKGINKENPIMRSSLSGQGHKYPIRSMSVVGTEMSHELVTCSADGTICHWDIAGSSALAEPMRCSVVKSCSKQHLGRRADSAVSALTYPVDASCLVFGQGTTTNPYESRKVFIGTQEGGLVESLLPVSDAAGAELVSGHEGVITGMQMNPSHGKGFRDLLLTSSVDWTVKLWSTTQGIAGGGGKPLLEFRNTTYDYVVDVQWSPINPCVFATITSGCDLVLWNIAHSTVDCSGILKLCVDNKQATSLGYSQRLQPRTLNRMQWSADGRRILCADSQGTVHVVSVSEAAAVARAGDEGRFELAILSEKSNSSSLPAAAAAAVEGHAKLEENEEDEEGTSVDAIVAGTLKVSLGSDSDLQAADGK